jgi:hypothetical protein
MNTRMHATLHRQASPDTTAPAAMQRFCNCTCCTSRPKALFWFLYGAHKGHESGVPPVQRLTQCHLNTAASTAQHPTWCFGSMAQLVTACHNLPTACLLQHLQCVQAELGAKSYGWFGAMAWPHTAQDAKRKKGATATCLLLQATPHCHGLPVAHHQNSQKLQVHSDVHSKFAASGQHR